MLPLGIVIPCKNSMAYLPRHLDFLDKWVDAAEEIVVVDSFSEDGSMDYLKKRIKHPKAQFLTHPPGLYASWNFGITNVRAKYVYISTIGDTITGEGLSHMVDVAEKLETEVVISKPQFFQESGREVLDLRWPIDDVIAQRAISRPTRLSAAEVFLFTATHLDGALLGSCASNLFRTEILKKCPFPTEFGKPGDGAWPALYFDKAKWAVTPKVFSTFLRQPDFASKAELQTWKTSVRLDKVLKKTLATLSANSVLTPEDIRKYRFAELLEEVSQWLDYKQRFDRDRASRWPWIANPFAWQDRIRRNQHRREANRLRNEALLLLP